MIRKLNIKVHSKKYKNKIATFAKLAFFFLKSKTQQQQIFGGRITKTIAMFSELPVELVFKTHPQDMCDVIAMCWCAGSRAMFQPRAMAEGQ